MANVVQTNEGGESELDEWLKQNRLYTQTIRQKFAENNVILQDLKDVSTSPVNEIKLN